MLSITIITIVVVAIPTGIILCLAWLEFSACLKAYKQELETGKHDLEICREQRQYRKDKHAIVKAIGYAMTGLFIIIIMALFIIGIVFAASNEAFTINGKTAYVIKSGSMSGFYNENLENQYEELGYSKNLQYQIGDICIFEKTDSINIGEVYAYAYNGSIITHRVVDTYVNEAGKTYYIFRGDNNQSQDQKLVSEDQILYHYTGIKIPAIGGFILYAQSYIGIWSLISIAGVVIISDLVLRKIQNLNDERLALIGGAV